GFLRARVVEVDSSSHRSSIACNISPNHLASAQRPANDECLVLTRWRPPILDHLSNSGVRNQWQFMPLAEFIIEIGRKLRTAMIGPGERQKRKTRRVDCHPAGEA